MYVCMYVCMIYASSMIHIYIYAWHEHVMYMCDRVWVYDEYIYIYTGYGCVMYIYIQGMGV